MKIVEVFKIISLTPKGFLKTKVSEKKANL